MTHATAHQVAATATLYLGAPDEALEMLDEVRQVYRRQGVMRRSPLQAQRLIGVAGCALAKDDATLARRCRAELGSGSRRFRWLHSLLVDAILACVEGDDDEARTSLARLRDVARETGFEVFEVIACRALGRLDPGPEGAEARSRYLKSIESAELVDPDLFAWTWLSYGPRPPRTGTTRSEWSPSDAQSATDSAPMPTTTRAP